jgi:hypothetical protein
VELEASLAKPKVDNQTVAVAAVAAVSGTAVLVLSS